MRQVNKTPCGVFMGETEAMTSSGTCTVRAPSGSSGRAKPSVHTTLTSSAPHSSASASSLGLSATNSPQDRR